MNVLIISPNGYGNVGDDICALAGSWAVKKVRPDAVCKISSPPMKKAEMNWADVVILSGGGVIYDREESNVNNYMQYIDKAYELGKKSAVLGVGIQGIVTQKGAERYKESLSKCEFVSVRTEKDKELLDKTGFTGSVPTFDIAYFIDKYVAENAPLSLRASRAARKLNIIRNNEKKNIGIVTINLKMLKKDKYGGVFKDFDTTIESFIRKNKEKYNILLLQHAKEDGKQMKQLARKYGVTFVPYKKTKDIFKLYDIYSSLDAMIGVRLHSIALGIISKTKVVGVGSTAAKQFRLANHGLPTLKEQFCALNEAGISKLQRYLEKPDSNLFEELKTLSSEEYDYIEEKNKINLSLLDSLLNK